MIHIKKHAVFMLFINSISTIRWSSDGTPINQLVCLQTRMENAVLQKSSVHKLLPDILTIYILTVFES